MILAIDTSAGQCAVALAGGMQPVLERAVMERGHAETLFPMIESAMARAGAAYRHVSRIAACTGPGSFTGVRLGVAAARGLALALGIPAIGVSRFEALAAEAGGRVAVCLTGRGNSVYVQVFETGARPLDEPRMVAAEALGAAIPPSVTRVAGDAASLIAGDAGEAALLPEGLPHPLVIARLAEGRDTAEPPRPLYLRGADAAPPREAPPPILD